MKTTDEFDRILNNALCEYREAEPLAGLEDRVLRRLQQQNERRQLWWRWSFAAGLTITILAVAAWFELRDPAYVPLIEQTTAQQATPAPGTTGNLAEFDGRKPNYPETFPAETLVRPARVRTPAKGASAPAKRSPHNRFPVPAPLTSEERALVALARSNPQALQALPRTDEELAIAPITIQPLDSNGGENQGDN